MTSVDDVNTIVKNVEEADEQSKWKLPTKVTTLIPQITFLQWILPQNLIQLRRNILQELISMLRQGTETGRVNVLHEASILS